jgi:hypothetical protein
MGSPCSVQVGSGLHCQLVETTGNSALSGGLHCTGGETMKTWGGGSQNTLWPGELPGEFLQGSH